MRLHPTGTEKLTERADQDIEKEADR